jgi:hypothetical protein
MMTYEILTVTQMEDTINSFVRYNIDGTIIETTVSSFMPNTVDDIYNGIVNRAYSEQTRLNAIANNQILVPEVQTGVIVPIPENTNQ